jgi:DNA mismatch endonuclease (patch repair protein)
MDNVSRRKRRKIMQANKPKDTKPEKAVRSLLYSMGFRFRKNVKGLPGTPDVLVLGCRTVIFVNGCFWHAHGCGRSSVPKTNVKFWRDKMERNKERDRENAEKLAGMGYAVLTVWECELADMRSIKRFFKQNIKRECPNGSKKKRSKEGTRGPSPSRRPRRTKGKR